MRNPPVQAGDPGEAADRLANPIEAEEERTGDRPCADASGRRGVLAGGALAVAALCCPGAEEAAAQTAPPAPRMARPAAGDVLVFAAGEKSGKPIALSDLAPGGPQVLAWAMEPGSGVVRNGSRLNQVVLVRLDPGALDEATGGRSAEGVVAYSAVCTHAQCAVSEWRTEKGVLHCPCHQSEFDPRQGGKVVGGPAQRPLAALPLKVAEGGKPEEAKAAADEGAAGGVLVVARPFTGRVGAAT